VIAARLAAPRRAAPVALLILGAALLRTLLLPLGDLESTLVFAACLALISYLRPGPSAASGEEEPRATSPAKGEGGASAGWSALLGVATGIVLLIPLLGSPLTGRPLTGFWTWGAIAAVVATLEETAIRGSLYRQWGREFGPIAAIAAGAIVFALIHLPRYGLAAMPLDLAVGLALGGLRALTGRVFPCAIAHTIADWGAWFWA
jgi:membrane protease YdiL (CAAX protease family)